jgi:hypothetical protein
MDCWWVNDSTWLLLLAQLCGTLDGPIIPPKKLSQGNILVRIAVSAVVGIHGGEVEVGGELTRKQGG